MYRRVETLEDRIPKLSAPVLRISASLDLKGSVGRDHPCRRGHGREVALAEFPPAQQFTNAPETVRTDAQAICDWLTLGLTHDKLTTASAA